MASRVRIGLIGCGAISKRHTEWLLAKPECSVGALCDISERNLAHRRAQIADLRPDDSVGLYSDYRRMLEDRDLDGVAVLLPHSLHFEVAKDALEAGLHVLVEKPMTTSIREAEELVRLQERSDRVLAIAYQRAHMSEYLAVRRMILEGDLGSLRFVSAHLEQSWYRHITDHAAARPWKVDRAHSGGGQLVDTGSHTLGALIHVTGLEPAEVYAVIENCGLGIDVNSALAVRFHGGAVGSLMIGGFGHSVTEVLRVVGEKKSARILFRTVREQSLEIDGNLVDAHRLVPGSNPDAHFVDAILGVRPVEAGPLLGLKVAQLSEAAYRSAEERAPVFLKAASQVAEEAT